MSEIWIGVAFFRSVWPGAARTARAASAKVTFRSEPLSVVKTTDLPLMDLTVPTAFATGACADAVTNSETRIVAIIPVRDLDFQADFVAACFTGALIINSIMRLEVRGVKNCQTRVKVAGRDI